MNKMKQRFGVFLVIMSMAASMTAASDSAAAKLPKLSKNRVSVQAGKTVQLKLKNVSPKAKVSWTSKSKKIAKITQSTKKTAKIRGIKTGKTTITAKYKLGKIKKTLSCKITVKKKAAKPAVTSPAPVESPTAAATAPASTSSAAPPASSEPDGSPAPISYKWVTTWGTAEEKCDTTKDAMPKMPLTDTTVRQIIRVTTGGQKLRLRLSNQYGESDVEIQSLHLAKQVQADASTIDVSTDAVVKVNGSEQFTIPKGKVIVTDEVDFSVNALDNVAISAYFGAAPTQNITGHRGARATTYQVAGNQVSAEAFSSVKKTTSWFFLADASIWSPDKSKAVVCFGDSITDGYGTDATYLGKKPDS